MNMALVKRLTCGLAGAVYLGFTCLGIVTQTMAGMIVSAIDHTGSSDMWKISVALLLYGFAAVALLVVAIWRESLLLERRRHCWLFLLAAAFAASNLAIYLLNDSQGFHFGHVLLSLSVALLFHDFLREALRRKRLRELTGGCDGFR
ncbi:hypothetical protein N9B73_11595 [Verrucomicrobiales bacterium]|nr:hypothetical protein [Verrucomicrobiales bacterium]